ncbi:unnamed protein product [Ectocarpus sp. 13 AM-2016]
MTNQANPRQKRKATKAKARANKNATPRPRPRVPEADPIQEYWSRKISPGKRRVEFKGGGPGGVTVLRKDVPKFWRTVKNRKGVCCVYFVKGERHFLTMVSEKELNKMKGTIGNLEMTNHAKTLAYGIKAAKKRKGVPNFSVVDACFGFWFDVCKDSGVEFKWKSCANYFNTGSGQSTRQLATKQEKSLLAALDTVSAIPKDSEPDSEIDSESDSESDSGSVIDLSDESSSEESDSASDSESDGPIEVRIVGKRIKVFWEEFNRWYRGKVVKFSHGMHLIYYDDGDKASHALKNEKWKVVG